MISASVLTKKCSVKGELISIEKEAVLESSDDEKKETVIEAPVEEEVLEPVEEEVLEPVEEEVLEPVEEKVPSTCPCIIKTKEGPRKCGRKIKEFGVCGLHRTKCVQPNAAVVNPAAAAVASASEAAMEPSRGCPCIIISRKGEKKPCGRPIKEHGACGIHQKKCLQPDGTVVVPAGGPQIAPVERRATTPAPPAEAETCPCIVKGKKGKPDKVCGRRAKINGKCLLHERKCVTAAPAAADEPAVVAPAAAAAAEEDEEVDVEQVEAAAAESPLLELKEPEPEPVFATAGWKVDTAQSLDDVYGYLVNVPEEVVDLGDQVLLVDQILTYLTASK